MPGLSKTLYQILKKQGAWQGVLCHVTGEAQVRDLNFKLHYLHRRPNLKNKNLLSLEQDTPRAHKALNSWTPEVSSKLASDTAQTAEEGKHFQPF